MNYILFDDSCRENLLPLTFTRPVSEIRVGILTISEKWKMYLNADISYSTQEYLSQKFPSRVLGDNIFINGSLLPDSEIVKEINRLNFSECLCRNGVILAFRVSKDDAGLFNGAVESINLNKREYVGDVIKIEYPWDIFSQNEHEIIADLTLVTKGKESLPLGSSNKLIGNGIVFIEEGAKVECATLNTTYGPIYIGKDAEVMEGALIRGPFALCEHSAIKMGAKIYGATTIGPHSKVGGEVSNSVIFGYSNKAHDGFLGNSVLGEWCNLGADTNNSNLKNNYALVKVWNYPKEKFINTGLQFCGLIMGDHSKTGINTMFNTGTVVGVSANIFGDGFPRNFIPSFSWGGAQGFSVYAINKAYEVAEQVMARRHLVLTEADKKILQTVFDSTEKYRRF